MSKKNIKPDPKMQAWIDAKRRHRLSRAHIQMAYELGMNPKKFGKIDNHKQEPWKAPLPIFIEDLYFKRFGKERPDVIVSIEERFRLAAGKKAKKSGAKLLGREAKAASPASPEPQSPPSGEVPKANQSHDRQGVGTSPIREHLQRPPEGVLPR